MKKLLALVLAGIMIFSFGACTGGKRGVNETGEDGKIILKIGLPSGGDVTPMDIVESFIAENPDIEVQVDEAPWSDFKSKLKVQMTSDNIPNVFITDSGYAASLAEMGAVADLKDYIAKDLNADDYSAALFGGTDSKGVVYGVPHGLNALGLFYNKTLFDEAGIEYPTEDWTFEDLYAAARKLTKDTDGDGETDVYGYNYGTNVTEGWLPLVLAKGGAPLNEDKTKSNFEDPKTIEGLELLRTPQVEGFAPTLEWATAQGGISAFYQGKLAMMLTASGNVKAINSNAPEGFDWDVQMVPKGWDGNRHAVYVPNYWQISAKSDQAHRDAAWKWIKHYMSETSQKRVGEEFLAGFPIHNEALKAMAEKGSKPANLMAFNKGINDGGVTLYENGKYEEWRPMVDETAAKIRQGLITAEDAAKEIHSKLTKILGQ